MAISATGSKICAVVCFLHASVRPHPILRLFLLLHWAVIWPRLTAGMWQGGAPLCRSVSLQTTSLKLTQRTQTLATVKISAYAPFDNAAISGRCQIICHLVSPHSSNSKIASGIEYWIAPAQWTAVIDAGARIDAHPHPTPPPAAPDVSFRGTACTSTVEWTASRVINPGGTETCIYSLDCEETRTRTMI